MFQRPAFMSISIGIAVVFTGCQKETPPSKEEIAEEEEHQTCTKSGPKQALGALAKSISAINTSCVPRTYGMLPSQLHGSDDCVIITQGSNGQAEMIPLTCESFWDPKNKKCEAGCKMPTQVLTKD